LACIKKLAAGCIQKVQVAGAESKQLQNRKVFATQYAAAVCST
jgi:hypothetical protein